MNKVNIFTYYKQKENQFTNGLISLLKLSRLDNPQFVTDFLSIIPDLVLTGEVNKFRVLQEKETGGTADAELAGEDCRIWIESKIVSGSLRSDQIDAHLKSLSGSPKKLKRLLLLTPDDSNSSYINQFVSKDPRIRHLAWRAVYDFLEDFVKNKPPSVFSKLVVQFRERIHDKVFEEDYAGIIQTIQFGEKSGVYPDSYLTELKTGEFSTRWNTPDRYKELDGPGRKLMLYVRRQGITVEVEIKEVKSNDTEPDFPFTNVFEPSTLRFFEPPIPLNRIRGVKGLENFAKGQSAFRNITHEHYRKLTEGMKKIC